MKKIIGVLFLIMSLTIVGCDKTSKQEKAMKEYVSDFYTSFQKGDQSITETSISIAELQNAVDLGIADYDMKKIKGCKDTSYTKITINQETRDIETYTHHLECE